MPAVEVADHRQHGGEGFLAPRLDRDLGLAGGLARAGPGDEVAEGAAVLRRDVDEEGLAPQEVRCRAGQGGRRPVRLLDDAVDVRHQVAEGGFLEELEVAVALALQLFAGGWQLLVLLLQLLIGHLELEELDLEGPQLLHEPLRVGEEGGLCLESAELLLGRGKLASR